MAQPPNSGSPRTLYLIVGILIVIVAIGAIAYFGGKTGGVNETATEPMTAPAPADNATNSTTTVPAPAPAPAAPAEGNSTGTQQP